MDPDTPSDPTSVFLRIPYRVPKGGSMGERLNKAKGHTEERSSDARRHAGSVAAERRGAENRRSGKVEE